MIGTPACRCRCGIHAEDAGWICTTTATTSAFLWTALDGSPLGQRLPVCSPCATWWRLRPRRRRKVLIRGSAA